MSDPFRTPPKHVSDDWRIVFHEAMKRCINDLDWSDGKRLRFAGWCAEIADTAQAEIDRRGGA